MDYREESQSSPSHFRKPPKEELQGDEKICESSLLYQMWSVIGKSVR